MADVIDFTAYRRSKAAPAKPASDDAMLRHLNRWPRGAEQAR